MWVSVQGRDIDNLVCSVQEMYETMLASGVLILAWRTLSNLRVLASATMTFVRFSAISLREHTEVSMSDISKFDPSSSRLYCPRFPLISPSTQEPSQVDEKFTHLFN